MTEETVPMTKQVALFVHSCLSPFGTHLLVEVTAFGLAVALGKAILQNPEWGQAVIQRLLAEHADSGNQFQDIADEWLKALPIEVLSP